MIALLESRKETMGAPNPEDPSGSSSSILPRQEVFKRIEEDRERHKRLRERRWVQPVSYSNAHSTHPPSLASFLPLLEDDETRRKKRLPLDVEFENDWETTSDWNEDDDDAAMEENEFCFPQPRSRRYSYASMDTS